MAFFLIIFYNNKHRYLPSFPTRRSSDLSGTNRAELVRAIGAFGEDAGPAVKAMAEALADPDPEVRAAAAWAFSQRSEEHTSELQSQFHLVCRLLLEKKKQLQAWDRSEEH